MILADFDTKQITAHIEGRIAATAIEEDPFPHLVIADLLPPEAYEAVLRHWPPDELFRINRSMERKDVNVRRDLADLPEPARGFWTELRAWTTAANRAIALRFAPYARLKYELFLGPRWQELIGEIAHIIGEAHLAYYSGKVGLAPHIDHPKLVTNAFLYCSERHEEEPELGTVLYAGRGFAMPDNKLALTAPLIARLLRRVKVVPYRANLCLAYLNTPRSFHGVDAMDLGDRHRRLLMFGSMLRIKDAVRLFGPEYAPP